MFVFLLVLLTAVSAQPRMSKEQIAEILNSEAPNINLDKSVMASLARYDCALDSPACSQWRALGLSALLAKEKINCDEITDNEVCMAARKWLGDDDATDMDIKQGLRDVLYEGLQNKEQMLKLKGMMMAIRDYICWRQPDLETCVKPISIDDVKAKMANEETSDSAEGML